MHPMLNTAIKAARRASTIINRASFDIERIEVQSKSHNDLITEVDKASEAAIIETLKTAYPSHAFLAEESANSLDELNKHEFLWIIDPLDGTTNFVHGFPQYSVSIALQQKGIITQAVVYDPSRNELFAASKGAGAFLNDKRIRVSKCEKLSQALIGTGFPYKNFDNLENYVNMFKAITPKCHGLRRPGSAALDLAYVAAGRLDGFFEKDLKPWDIAAGALLVTEAGGIVANFHGEADYLKQGDVIAGTPKVFAQTLQTLKEFA